MFRLRVEHAPFITALNRFHPRLCFTFTSSPISINQLDLTIFKGEQFRVSNHLDLRTSQKPLNKYMYQYVSYTSYHPQSVFKWLIMGECIRYARTNTSRENYTLQVHSSNSNNCSNNITYLPVFPISWGKMAQFHGGKRSLSSSPNQGSDRI